jgi:outer membrane immunogenic protein
LGTASAADMAVKAAPPGAVATVYDWTGIYLGGSVGGVWDKPGVEYFPIYDSNVTFSGANSWIAGVHAVGMWQISHLVVGAETDYRWTSINHSGFCPLDTFTCTQNTPNMFTAGGRIGGAWDKWLLYANGGYAQTRINVATFDTVTGERLNGSRSNSDGWYVGAGIAYAVTPNIIFGAQYTHVVANEAALTFASPDLVDSRSVSNRFDMIEFRADFKLWPWSSASSY